MTLAKHKSPSALIDKNTVGMKDTQQRRAESYKYTAPSPKSITWTNSTNASDGILQPTTKRRRYMRRGSKCPSMLMLVPIMTNYPRSTSLGDGSCDNREKSQVLSSTLTTPSVNPGTTTPAVVKSTASALHMKQPRRLSMMTALKLSLERISMVDSPTHSNTAGPHHESMIMTTPLSMRMMTPEERRKSTYELLSQV